MRKSLCAAIMLCLSLGLLGASVALGENVPNSGSVDLSAQWLNAGPIRLKLQDGQLRYLHVGDKEVCRRIYFAVRDGNWATAMPTYSLMKLDKADDHFTVEMAAHCKMGRVDYSWTGKIVGSADGKITFHAVGTPKADFESNRIGLCVLYGTASLAGQEFETDGQTPAKGTFPKLLSPVHVADQFHTLRYETANGLRVSCGVDGAIFDMEDQRNWGDSSWKAFAPLPYDYKKVAKGDVRAQTVTLTVSGVSSANRVASQALPIHVNIGLPIGKAKIPQFLPAGTIPKALDFTDFSFNHDAYKSRPQIEFSYIATTHLPDNDTILENLPAIADQAIAVGMVNPTAQIRVGPIGLQQRSDPRDNTPMTAAWSVGVVKNLALGGAAQAEFRPAGAIPAFVRDAIAAHSGEQLIEVSTAAHQMTRVLALGCINDKHKTIFVANLSAERAPVVVDYDGLAPRVTTLSAGQTEQQAKLTGNAYEFELAPYEVRQLVYDRDKGR